MDYIREIIRLLNGSDERVLRAVYFFLLGLLAGRDTKKEG